MVRESIPPQVSRSPTPGSLEDVKTPLEGESRVETPEMVPPTLYASKKFGFSCGSDPKLNPNNEGPSQGCNSWDAALTYHVPQMLSYTEHHDDEL